MGITSLFILLTFDFFQVLLTMFLFYLTALSVGIEGGYSQPAVRFNNLNAGTAFALFVGRDFKIINTTLAFETIFYRGENAGYSFTTTGIRFEMSQRNWRFSPVIGCGADYVTRSINKNRESGFAFNYRIGLLINFFINRLRIYPKFCYEGITDSQEQAGFFNIKLGLDYEL